MAGKWRGSAVAAAVATLAISAPAAADTRLDAKAARQIAELQQFKRSLSGAERKLDSRLAAELSGRAIVPRASTGVRVSRGTAKVDVRATAVSDALLDRLKRIGAVVDHASRRLDSVRASVPVSRSNGWPAGRTSSGSTPRSGR